MLADWAMSFCKLLLRPGVEDKCCAMEYRRDSNGWVTFLEHCWPLGMTVVGLLSLLVVSFIFSLNGARWIWYYGISLTVAAMGVGLILYTKLPLYRQRRFFTFGAGALPADRRAFYRWGYGCVAVAVGLLLCLWLAKP